MTDGGETTMTRAKVVGKEKGLINVAQRRTDNPTAPGKAKATKVDPKGKENPQNLPSAIATPNPAATVGNLDTKIANAANENTMRKKRLNQLPARYTPSS